MRTRRSTQRVMSECDVPVSSQKGVHENKIGKAGDARGQRVGVGTEGEKNKMRKNKDVIVTAERMILFLFLLNKTNVVTLNVLCIKTKK